jgi:hypothetical protein
MTEESARSGSGNRQAAATAAAEARRPMLGDILMEFFLLDDTKLLPSGATLGGAPWQAKNAGLE